RHVGLGPDGNTAPRATPSLGKGGGADRGAACAFPGMPKKIPVSGVPISAKVTVDNVTTWWTRIPKSIYPHVNTDLSLCQAHGSGGSGSPVAPLGPGQLVQASTPFGGLNDGMQVSGVAVASVTSVEADLANGSVVHGWVAYGRGFPYAAWWLTYPQGIAATLVFRNAAGQAVKKIAEPYPPAGALANPVPITPEPGGSAPPYGRPCQQAKVPQVMDGIKVWTYVGFTVPEPVQPNH